MFNDLFRWLGPDRSRLTVGLVVVAGLLSLGLQVGFAGEDWLLSAQLAVFWLLLVGLVLVLGSRLSGPNRRRLWIIVGPGLALLGIGVLVPDLALFLGGAAAGWLVVAQVILRNQVQMEYRTAIRHLRHGEYPAALEAMTTLINAQPDDPNHRRFRAELYRLAGNLPLAVADYEAVIRLAPDSVDGYTGLGEVYAQLGDYHAAYQYALTALERSPGHWQAAYNVSMVEDRLGEAARALEHLQMALAAGVDDDRYRLLIHLWMARNQYRLGQTDEARAQLELVRQYGSSLKEWQLILASEYAAALRGLLEDDIRLAQQVIESAVSLEVLGSRDSRPKRREDSV